MNRPRAHLVAGVTSMAILLAGVAACGTDATAPEGSATPDGDATGAAVDTTPLVIWAVQSGHSDSYTLGAERWNEAHPDRPIEVQVMPDSGYKDKIRVALGAGEGPDLFYTWGGGGLQSYIDAGSVDPLDPWVEEYPELLSRYLPATLGPVEIDGQTWGVPIANLQPAVLFYNTEVFSTLGAEPPETWDELTDLIEPLNAEGIAPLTLAGQSKWPYLPYVSYLVDRIGGPEVFERIAAGEQDAWSDPAVLEALTIIQDLVRADGVTSDFASLAYETGAADALLYTGRAGMLVMLASAWGNIGKAAPEFVDGGGLEAVPFPAVQGGAGDPSNLVGNPSVYWALNSAATPGHKETAVEFLATIVEDDQWVQEIIERGGVPPVRRAEELLGDDALAFQKFVFDLAEGAEHFQQSWDQALTPEQGQALNTELDRVFLLQVTPEEFVDTMNATIS